MDHGNYEVEVSEKLQRGLTNLTLGWTEVVRSPTAYANSPKRGVTGAVLVGFPVGILRSIGRTLVGAYPLEGDVT